MKNATKLTLLYKNILTLLENYIKTYDLDVSVEELFVEFHRICLEHQKFELYLQEKEGNNFLNKMHRNKRLKEKRRLFELWYFSNSDKGVMSDLTTFQK